MRAAAWSASRDGLGFDVGHDNVLLLARSLAHKGSGRGRYRTRPERSLVVEMLSPRAGGVNAATGEDSLPNETSFQAATWWQDLGLQITIAAGRGGNRAYGMRAG